MKHLESFIDSLKVSEETINVLTKELSDGTFMAYAEKEGSPVAVANSVEEAQRKFGLYFTDLNSVILMLKLSKMYDDYVEDMDEEEALDKAKEEFKSMYGDQTKKKYEFAG